MDSLLAENPSEQKKSCDLRESLCYYISAILVLLTFIMSCISLGLTKSTTIMDMVYTFNFPYINKYVSFSTGVPVSLDENGNIWRGAGITIWRNSTVEKVSDLKRVKIAPLNGELIIVAYEGGVKVYKATCEGYTIEQGDFKMESTKDGIIRELITVDDGKYIIVGREKFVPFRIIPTKTNKVYSFKFVEGPVSSILHTDDQYPHMDNLDNKTFAITYEKGADIYTRYGTYKEDGDNKPSLEWSDETKVATKLNFHDIAGMDENHWIITATGSQDPSKPWTTVLSWLVTKSGSTVTVSAPITLPWSMSCNWFSMDNLGRNNVILAFTDDSIKGIEVVMIIYDRQNNAIYFGARRLFQTGGAMLHYERMELRVLNRQKFILAYEDGGATSLVMVMGAITYSNDIVVVSPNYVISRPGRDHHGPPGQTRFFFDITNLGEEHFFIFETRLTDIVTQRLHHGTSYPRVFGIVTKVRKDSVDVQMSGVVDLRGHRKLTPGRALYSDGHGEIVEGKPFGYTSRAFGSFYYVDRELIIDGRNLIGIAVTDKKVKMVLE